MLSSQKTQFCLPFFKNSFWKSMFWASAKFRISLIQIKCVVCVKCVSSCYRVDFLIKKNKNNLYIFLRVFIVCSERSRILGKESHSLQARPDSRPLFFWLDDSVQILLFKSVPRIWSLALYLLTTKRCIASRRYF